eukprot:6037138-Lingulodinium_polyedra.AAC.1
MAANATLPVKLGAISLQRTSKLTPPSAFGPPLHMQPWQTPKLYIDVVQDRLVAFHAELLPARSAAT